MLRCNMNADLATAERLDLEDVLGNLQHARRTEDLGRLAHLAYWDVRRWARRAQRHMLAERASDLIIRHPHQTRATFLELVDDVIEELECIRLGGR